MANNDRQASASAAARKGTRPEHGTRTVGTSGAAAAPARARIARLPVWIGALAVLAAVVASLLLTERSTTGSAGTPPVGLRVGQMAPNFTLTNLAGRRVSLAGFRGKPVLLHFWAVDCTTCQAEQADYLRAVRNLGSRAPTIVAVDAWGESAGYVAPYVRRHALPGAVLIDPSRNVFYSTYQGQGTPTAYYIDAHGVIRAEAIGQESYAQIVANAKRIVA